MAEKPKYLYGVIHGKGTGMGGPITTPGGQVRVSTVPYRQIACVVSDAPEGFLETLDKETLAHRLVNHQTVIEQVMQQHSVIPLKFGTIVEDEAEVKRILEAGYAEFTSRLDSLNGKIEMDVVATWGDLNAVIRVIGEEEEEIKRFKREIAKRPPDQTLQERIQLGVMIKAALDRKRQRQAAAMLELLQSQADDVKRHELMDDRMIFNCAFLLNRDRETTFDQALKALDRRYEGAMNFRCVGPLPPYSFSTLEVRRVGSDELNEARQALGLSEEATRAEMKEAYHRLSKDTHPDKDPANPGLAEEFERLTKAYRLLSHYCQDERCSFRADEAKEFVFVDLVKI